MNVCPKCKQGYACLACEHCAMKRSDEVVHAAQLEGLRYLEKHGGLLTKRSINGTKHLQMFRCEFTFCKLHIEPKHRKDFFDWRLSDLDTICSNCRVAIKSLLEEALECPPV